MYCDSANQLACGCITPWATSDVDELCKMLNYYNIDYCYVAAKATYIRLLFGQNGGFSALAPLKGVGPI